MCHKNHKKTLRGMPSAIALSILIHLGLFLLAGTLVIFTVVKKKDVEFEPPQTVERPKMKLKKPKVKIRKTARPKPTTRIVTKVNRADMPDIQLPAMSDINSGIAGSIGGIDMMTDFDEGGLFGRGQSIGNDLVGTFYDLKRDRSGRTIVMDTTKYLQEMKEFIRRGWDTSTLVRYYRSPKKLYAATIAIPPVQSTLAPLAFGEPEVDGYCFAVHYKGQLVYKDDITFRFWGLGDDILIVRVNGNIVLHAPYPGHGNYPTIDATPICSWQTSSPDSNRYWLGDHLSMVGDWITLEAGIPVDMEVLVGEVAGGLFQAMLTVEIQGETYERNPDRGGPTLPVFKTAPLSLDLIENIHADLDPGDACVTNGPVFCDYELPEKTVPYYDTSETIPPRPMVFGESNDKKNRLWTFSDDHRVEAGFITVVGNQVVVKDLQGKQLKIPLQILSPEDRLYVELETPPDFLINFSKKSSFIPPPENSPYVQTVRPLQIADYVFGTRLKQSSTKPYPHELHVEFFAFGEEVDGDNYVLLDRQKSSFTPSKENEGSFELYSTEPVRIQTTAIRSASPMRGTKYGGYLVTITDELGRIIQYKTSHDWLFDILENLKNVPIGKHFDKRGIRVGPPRPTREDRPGWI